MNGWILSEWLHYLVAFFQFTTLLYHAGMGVISELKLIFNIFCLWDSSRARLENIHTLRRTPVRPSCAEIRRKRFCAEISEWFAPKIRWLFVRKLSPFHIKHMYTYTDQGYINQAECFGALYAIPCLSVRISFYFHVNPIPRREPARARQRSSTCSACCYETPHGYGYGCWQAVASLC